MHSFAADVYALGMVRTQTKLARAVETYIVLFL